MRYLSVCSGIEAASAAWRRLGWEPAAFAEIEPFPSMVLASRYPDVPNLGDITEIDGSRYRGKADMLVGGTPCFPAGTLVLTPGGYRPIETLRIGDIVVTAKGNLRPVTDAGSKKAVTGELRIRGRAPISCTANHPFLHAMENGCAKVRADKAKGKPLARLVPAPCGEPEFPEGLSRADAAALAGHYASPGGCVGRNGTWPERHIIIPLVDEGLISAFNARFAGKLDYKITSIGYARIFMPELRDWLISNFGQDDANRRIPYWLYGQSLKNEFLSAWRPLEKYERGGDLHMVVRGDALAYGISDLFPGSSVAPETRPRMLKQGAGSHFLITVHTSMPEGQAVIGGCQCSYAGDFRQGAGALTDVYNITVDVEHTYIVNGMAVGNCQAFSVAGRRAGLKDERGNLALAFVRLADAVDPGFILWENVPGVLSMGDNAFGCFLGALCGSEAPLRPPGGKWSAAGFVYGPLRNAAWRILDAQYFGLAQRRKRVFVLACPKGGADPAEILLEWGDGRSDAPPARADVAGTLKGGSGKRGWQTGAEEAAGGYFQVSHWEGGPHPTLGSGMGGKSGGIGMSDQEVFSQQGACLVPGVVREASDPDSSLGHDMPDSPDIHEHGVRSQKSLAGLLADAGHLSGGRRSKPRLFLKAVSDAFRQWLLPGLSDRGKAGLQMTDIPKENPAYAPEAAKETRGAFQDSGKCGVRRLTPEECEILMGFPVGYTKISVCGKSAPDGPRYKALGNSMAVSVMRWIGERIQARTNSAGRFGAAEESGYAGKGYKKAV